MNKNRNWPKNGPFTIFFYLYFFPKQSRLTFAQKKEKTAFFFSSELIPAVLRLPEMPKSFKS